MLTEMTGRVTPQARPSAVLLGTKTYGTGNGQLCAQHALTILVLAEQRQVQQDFNRLRVCGHDDELADAAVERLGGLVGTLLELLVVRSLLRQIEDLLRQLRIRQREGFRVRCGHADVLMKLRGVRQDLEAHGWIKLTSGCAELNFSFLEKKFA